MKKIIMILCLLLFIAGNAQAQKKARPSSLKSEPIRVASGVMTANKIVISKSDWIRDAGTMMNVTLTGARLVAGQLELQGTTGKAPFSARLMNTLARSANPWPSAASGTARERKISEEAKQEAEKNEQTQSLYASTETGSGCEVIFLRLPNDLQVGVTLAHKDNAKGLEINQALCRVSRALTAKQNAADSLAKLNALLK